MTFRELLQIIVDMDDEDLNLEITVCTDDCHQHSVDCINTKMGFIETSAIEDDDWDDDDCC